MFPLTLCPAAGLCTVQHNIGSVSPSKTPTFPWRVLVLLKLYTFCVQCGFWREIVQGPADSGRRQREESKRERENRVSAFQGFAGWLRRVRASCVTPRLYDCFLTDRTFSYMPCYTVHNLTQDDRFFANISPNINFRGVLMKYKFVRETISEE